MPLHRTKGKSLPRELITRAEAPLSPPLQVSPELRVENDEEDAQGTHRRNGKGGTGSMRRSPPTGQVRESDAGGSPSAREWSESEGAAAAATTADHDDHDDALEVLYVLVAADGKMSRGDIVTELRQILPAEEVYPVGGEKVAVECSPERRGHVVGLLAEQPRVRWVERKPKWVLRNGYANKAIQSTDGLSTGIWSKGLRGEGQIVGVADTGIDIDSCFFRDADQVVAMCPSNATGHVSASDEAGCKNEDHRKVIMYRYLNVTDPSSNGFDAVEGHGTHVAGSVAGSASPSVSTSAEYAYASEYDGAAPNAKLTFDDISSDGEELDGIPEDLNQGLFPVSYWAGARTHCNSWGDSRTR